jgi:enoyl-CoA hydratase
MPHVSVERIGPVAVVRITLPEDFMTEETVHELNDATEILDADESCRAIVFTGGQDGVFIRHYHVGVLEQMSTGLRGKGMAFSEDRLLTRDRDIDVLFRRLGTTPKITIAAINGFAMGGGFEFCLACDLRVAQAGGYHLGLPEINIGILPGAGGTQRLARLVGSARALEMILRGRTVPPAEALDLGMVHEVTDRPVLQRAVELAGDYAEKSPLAIGHIKRLVREGVEMPLEDALTLERTLFLDLLVSDQANELMTKANAGGLDIRDVKPD